MNQNEFDQAFDQVDDAEKGAVVEPKKRGFTPADDDDDPTSNPTAYKDYQPEEAEEAEQVQDEPSEADQVQAATEKLQSFVSGAHNKFSNESGDDVN